MVSKTEYVQKHRQKLKDQGYVKREVWIPPHFTSLLKQFELSLRKGIVPNRITNQEEFMVMTTSALYTSLRDYGIDTGVLDAVLIDDVIQVQVTDLEDFPIYVTVGEAQIMALMPLINVSEIPGILQIPLNQKMLEMNTLVPLSDFSIVNGQYVLFGALSVNSSFDEVVEEIVMLANNVEDAFELINSIAN